MNSLDLVLVSTGPDFGPGSRLKLEGAALSICVGVLAAFESSSGYMPDLKEIRS